MIGHTELAAEIIVEALAGCPFKPIQLLNLSVAAEIDAGIIDESDKTLRPFDFEQDREAYRDWRRRHPAYRVPPLRCGTDRH